MQRALMWLNLYGCEAFGGKLKKGVKRQKMHFIPFWAYIGQPDNHIGWATLMPFPSIYPTNSRTNPLNFSEKYWDLWVLKDQSLKFSWKILRFGGVENLSFLSRPFWIFFFRKFFFASSQWKSVNIYWIARMGRNFDDGFQPKTTPA